MQGARAETPPDTDIDPGPGNGIGLRQRSNRLEGRSRLARRADVRRIGVLLPSSTRSGAGFWRVLPKHITQHVARMRLTQVEANSTLRIVEEIETESRKLADVDVDVIVLAATAPSVAQRHRVRSGADRAHRSGKRQARNHSLHGAARSVACAVPAKTYRASAHPGATPINRTTAAFIEARSALAVVAAEALGLVDNTGHRPSSIPKAPTMSDAASTGREADAVMLACEQLGTFAVIRAAGATI